MKAGQIETRYCHKVTTRYKLKCHKVKTKGKPCIDKHPYYPPSTIARCRVLRIGLEMIHDKRP